MAGITDIVWNLRNLGNVYTGNDTKKILKNLESSHEPCCTHHQFCIVVLLHWRMERTYSRTAQGLAHGLFLARSHLRYVGDRLDDGNGWWLDL